MNLSRPFIQRPVMTTLVMLSILFFGALSYCRLPVSDLPNVDLPTIEVSVDYPGASPEIMANSVATPLERQFMSIQGLSSVVSSSNTGFSNIVLTFNLDRDIDAASTDVQAMISVAEPNLPGDLPNNPTYRKVNPSAVPILYFALFNPNMTAGELYDYGSTYIGDHLSMIEGVSQVITYGSPYAARIQVDPEKLAAKNIGLDQIVSSLEGGNVNLPLGTLYGPKSDFNIEIDGQIMGAEGYNNLVIKNEKGELVKIQDVGRALDSVKKDKYFMHYFSESGDQNCLVLALQRTPGANTVEIVQRVNETLKNLSPQLPQSLKIEKIYDQSETILEGVKDVKVTLLLAFFLVVTIIYVLLGKALNTVIPSLALPMSVIGTFALMLLFGFSIDILSLLALTLAIGFLVDDAIVVLENSVRHVQAGESPYEAAMSAAKEISVTILSMTLCLIAAFIPMLFMGGIVGKLFREFAITIVSSVFISGFISLTLTPMLGSKFILPYSEQKKPKMERIAEKLNSFLQKKYEPLLKFSMRHKKWMLGLGTLSVLCSLLLFKLISKDFLPPDDVGFIEGWTLSRDGTSPYLMEDYHKEISSAAMKDPNVEALLSVSSFTNPNEGFVFFRLKPYSKRASMNQSITSLNERFHQIAGVNTYLSPLPLINLNIGTTAYALYQYALTSLDQKSLYSFAEKLTHEMQENSAFSSVSSDLRLGQPEWSFQIDRDKASFYNVSAKEIESFFQNAYSDTKVSQINGEINTYDVILETLPEFYKNPSVLSKLYVKSSKGMQVPLSEVVKPKETIGPLTINHYDGLSSVSISFNPAENMPLGKSLEKLDSLTRNKPREIKGGVIGTADIFKSSFANLSALLLVSFFVIYIVLGILYESFIHPLTVMSTLPPALVGGLFTLFIFNEPLSLYSFVGLILLIGIVLKNGIIMVDFANKAKQQENLSSEEAIEKAALIRFRPILMTSISAMIGALPIAIGIGGSMAQSRVSLGLVIVGGLLISQVFTLMLTPVIYSYFDRLQEKLSP